MLTPGRDAESLEALVVGDPAIERRIDEVASEQPGRRPVTTSPREGAQPKASLNYDSPKQQASSGPEDAISGASAEDGQWYFCGEQEARLGNPRPKGTAQ